MILIVSSPTEAWLPGHRFGIQIVSKVPNSLNGWNSRVENQNQEIAP
jgi:hypothetical protein